MLQDYKLGLRMLLKYPGLTIAGGLALAIAIGVGAGYYDLVGKAMMPTIPLPEGDRLVLIETQNTLTNVPEPRVVRDFLEWRRELQTIEDLGAYRTDIRNLIIGNAAPVLVQMAELTAGAFSAARVPPCSVVPCSTPTNCREPPAWSCWGTTCGNAPLAAGRTSSGWS